MRRKATRAQESELTIDDPTINDVVALNLPQLRFMENAGQWDEQALYRADAGELEVYFSVDGVTYVAFEETGAPYNGEELPTDGDTSDAVLDDEADTTTQYHVVRATFVDGAEELSVGGGVELPGVTNFIRGEGGLSATGAKSYDSLRYSDVWPGVDVLYTQPQVENGVIKSTFELEAGVSPDVIVLDYEGADSLWVREDGKLVIETRFGPLFEDAPSAWQEYDGLDDSTITRSRAVEFSVDETRVSFDVSDVDGGAALWIDPTVFYSRDFGGSNDDYVYAIDADDTGVYTCGMTESTDFPTTAGAFDSTSGGLEDVYAAKFTSPASGDLIWATYVASGDDEKAIDCIVDGGELIMTGFTDMDSAADYPTTAGAARTVQASTADHGFITRLNAAGSALVCSTYIHPSNTSTVADTTINGISQFGDGTYLIGGVTESNLGWPNTGGYQPTDPTNSTLDDGFIARVAENCSAINNFSYFGTTNTLNIEDSFIADVFMQGGNAYAVAVTDSEELPTTAGAWDSAGDGQDNSDDLVVFKMNSTLSTLMWSSYLGDEGALTFSDENGGVFSTFSRFNDQNQAWHPLYVNAAGETYVTGITEGSDFPTTTGAFQENAPNSGNTIDDGFVTIFNATGTDLIASTYLGGAANDDGGKAIGVDDQGNVVVIGWTESTNFPVVNAVQGTHGGGTFGGDAFHVLLEPDLSDQICGTFYGGNNDERAMGLYVPGGLGEAIFGGWTESANFPQVGGGDIGSASNTIENSWIAAITCGGANVAVDVDSIEVTSLATGRECITAGDFVQFDFDLVNTGLSDQEDNLGPEFAGSLTGRHIAQSCVASAGTCSVTSGGTFEWNGRIDGQGGVVSFTVVTRVAGGVPAGHEFCISGVINFDSQGIGANTEMAQLEEICSLTDCPPTVFPNDQLGCQVHLPILNFLGQDDLCESWIEVQNLGCGFAKASLITWGEPGFCPPQAAGPLKVECTGLLKPGSTWNLLGAQIPNGSKSGILFKWTAEQLSEIGVDLGFDDVVADYMCETLFFGVVGDADDYRRFKKAYNEGLEFGGVPMDRATGDGLIAVDVHRKCPGDVTPGVEVTSKYNGIAGTHLGMFDPVYGGHGYYVPLVYADKAGFTSIMYLQNGGLECTSIEVWFQEQDNCLRATICDITTLAPGETYQLDANDCVGPDFQGSAWVRTTQPMGIAVDIVGRDILMTYVGEPAEINFTFDPEAAYTRTANQVAFGPLVYSEYQGWDTGVQVQNMSAVTAAKVKVYFMDRSGDIVTTLVDWVCPRGSQTFFLPVIAALPGNWVGSIRVESQEWLTPGGPLVASPNIVAVATLIKYNDAARTETTEAIAYNLLPEHKVYDWQIGFGGGSLDSGVGLIAIPSLLKDLDGSGLTSELAIANVVPKPGFTDLAIYIFDQNGMLDYICQKLSAKQVEYIDLQTWGYVNPGFKGSAIISAQFWEHDVFDDTGFFLRNLVGLGAVAVERNGTRLGEDAPGDEAAGARGIPFSNPRTEDEEDLGFEHCFMADFPICPGTPFARLGPGDEAVCIDTPFGEIFAATLTMDDAGWPDFATYTAQGRTFRDGVASMCTPAKTCPGGGFNAGTTFNYDLYFFQNCDANEKCITVNLNTGACGTDVHAVAYAGRVPAGSSMDCMYGTVLYVGDVGSSVTQPFSFIIPDGTTEWTLMFHNNFGANACGYGFDMIEN